MHSATLLQFTQINDAAAATTKKLQKQAILSEYFASLAEQDLRRAVRYAAGRPFAATDERTLNVGGALVSQVVLEILPITPREFHDLAVRSGEIGEALARVWSRRGVPLAEPSPTASGAAGAKDQQNGAGFRKSESEGLSVECAETDPTRDHATSLFHNDTVNGSSGDGGALTEERSSNAPLLLSGIAASFEAIAAVGRRDDKGARLRELFQRCQSGREAAYLAKIIFGDLRTGVQEGVLQAAIAIAFGKTLPEIQRAQLLVGDLDEVAALAKRDALSAASFRLFHPILPMLATAQETAEIAAGTMAGRTFLAEDKLDGIRAHAHKSGDCPAARVHLYTRDLARADESFPDVVAALSKLPGEFLLDGEIVPFHNGRVLPFAHIQKRLGRKVSTPRMLEDNPCTFIAFDMLYRDGQLLMDCPLRVRQAALAELACAIAPPLRHIAPSPVESAGQIVLAFDAARERRNEGIVLKDPESPYSPGRRGQMWLKLKTHLPTFDCVVTAAEYGHGKRRAVLSDYTFAVWDGVPGEEGSTLVNVGKAYSGVTDEEIDQLTKIFLNISILDRGRVHAVRPQVVLEIACDQIQKSARHASGYALRFPRIKRIRWDKRPEDADTLGRVAEVYESVANFAKTATVEKVPEAGLFD